MRRSFFSLTLILLLASVLGAGCVKEKAQKAASPAKGFFKQVQTKAKDAFQNAGDKYGKSLGDAQKKIVDEWLANNQLNEYGDKLDTLYAGGTPLFDELTGASIDRFEYLLKKFPNLRDIINQELSPDK